MMSIIGGLARASHPAPSVAVTALGLTIGSATGLALPTLTVLGSALLLGQVSVGWSNDWIDAKRDRVVARLSKPVAVGTVSVAVVRAAAFVAVALALIVTAFLGWLCVVAHACALVSAWLYNAGLKKTVASWVPFAVSFGLLPAIASLAFSPPKWPTAWIVAAAACLGIAAHFANVLPDLADDKNTGVRGLPHRVGATRSGIAAFGLLGVASVAVMLGFFLAPAVEGEFIEAHVIGTIVIVGLTVTAGIFACGVTLVVRKQFGRNLFHLIIAGAFADAAMIALAGMCLITS